MRTAPVSKKYLTRKEAATRYSVSLRFLDDLLADGVLPAARLSRRCLRIPVEKADQAIERFEIGGAK